MQQVPVSNIIMSMKSPKRSIVKSSLFSYFIKLISFCEIAKTEFGPCRGAEGNVLVAECMDDHDISSHLASCHLSKCSEVNENGLILARVSI